MFSTHRFNMYLYMFLYMFLYVFRCVLYAFNMLLLSMFLYGLFTLLIC